MPLDGDRAGHVLQRRAVLRTEHTGTHGDRPGQGVGGSTGKSQRADSAFCEATGSLETCVDGDRLTSSQSIHGDGRSSSGESQCATPTIESPRASGGCVGITENEIPDVAVGKKGHGRVRREIQTTKIRSSATAAGNHISSPVGFKSPTGSAGSGVPRPARSLGIHFHAAQCGANHERQCAASDRHDSFDELVHKLGFTNF